MLSTTFFPFCIESITYYKYIFFRRNKQTYIIINAYLEEICAEFERKKHFRPNPLNIIFDDFGI